MAIESDQKSESGSELDPTNEQPKLHVEFSEAEIISTDTNTISFKVKFNDRYIQENCCETIYSNLGELIASFLVASTVDRKIERCTGA